MASSEHQMHARHAADPRRRNFMRAGVALGLTLAGLPARGVVPGGQSGRPADELVAALLREVQARYRSDARTRTMFAPSGGATAAMVEAANAPPDGESLLLTLSSTVTLLPYLKKLPIDPEKTLEPVVGIGQLGYGFIVGPAVPAAVKTMADYLSWAQANPILAMYGVPGRGTSSHFLGQEITRLSEAPLKSVGYQGLQPVLQDVAKGSMPAAMTVLQSGSDPLNYPTLRTLAVSSAKRWPGFPEVPTLLELGLAETPTVDSVGVFTTIRAPDRQVGELRDAAHAALRRPETIATLSDIGLQPMPSDLAYPVQIARERAEWQARVDRRHFAIES